MREGEGEREGRKGGKGGEGGEGGEGGRGISTHRVKELQVLT